MNEGDAKPVRRAALRKLGVAVFSVVATSFTVSALVVFGLWEGQPLLSLHYLFTLAVAVLGFGWATKTSIDWLRLVWDLLEKRKETWTTADFHKSISRGTVRSGPFIRYSVLVDGEKLRVHVDRLEELGYLQLRPRLPTHVEVSRRGRVLLRARQSHVPAEAAVHADGTPRVQLSDFAR